MSWAAPRRMREALERIARVPEVASRLLAPVLTTYAREQFAASHDPYGRPWAKLAPATVRKKGHDRILIDTGETAATIQAVPWGSRSVAGVRIRTMGWHQYPTAHRPARPILPTGPLPPRWAAAARDALREARDRAIKGT